MHAFSLCTYLNNKFEPPSKARCFLVVFKNVYGTDEQVGLIHVLAPSIPRSRCRCSSEPSYCHCKQTPPMCGSAREYNPALEQLLKVWSCKCCESNSFYCRRELYSGCMPCHYSFSHQVSSCTPAHLEQTRRIFSCPLPWALIPLNESGMDEHFAQPSVLLMEIS